MCERFCFASRKSRSNEAPLNFYYFHKYNASKIRERGEREQAHSHLSSSPRPTFWRQIYCRRIHYKTSSLSAMFKTKLIFENFNFSHVSDISNRCPFLPFAHWFVHLRGLANSEWKLFLSVAVNCGGSFCAVNLLDRNARSRTEGQLFSNDSVSNFYFLYIYALSVVALNWIESSRPNHSEHWIDMLTPFNRFVKWSHFKRERPYSSSLSKGDRQNSQSATIEKAIEMYMTWVWQEDAVCTDVNVPKRNTNSQPTITSVLRLSRSIRMMMSFRSGNRIDIHFDSYSRHESSSLATIIWLPT